MTSKYFAINKSAFVCGVQNRWAFAIAWSGLPTRLCRKIFVPIALNVNGRVLINRILVIGR
jgi:hypothetical protein